MREEDIRPAALFDEFLRLLRGDAERLARRRHEFVRVACPFCGADDPRVAFEKETYAYQSCAGCGSLYASPRPTADALAGYARTSDAVRFWSTHFYRETAAARRERMFRPRARLTAELVSRFQLRPVTLVDIGSGYGLLLQEARELRVFDRLCGVEPDSNLARICREDGFEVVEKWVEEIGGGELGADVATCFEVLEHAFDVATFLQGCARTVRPGGLLLLTTLMADGFDLQVLWERSRSISPPQHINFPSLAGMRLLVERCGLEVVELSTPGQLDVDIVRNAVRDGVEVPRFARKIVESDDAVRADFQSFLQTHGLSSHVRCIIRKPG